MLGQFRYIWKEKKNTINTQVSASWVNNNRLSSINMVQNLSIFWNTPMTTKLQSWLHTKTLLVSKTIYYWCSTSWFFFLNKILAIKLKPNKIRNPNREREREHTVGHLHLNELVIFNSDALFSVKRLRHIHVFLVQKLFAESIKTTIITKSIFTNLILKQFVWYNYKLKLTSATMSRNWQPFFHPTFAGIGIIFLSSAAFNRFPFC